MIFFGAFFGADELSMSIYPENIGNITSLTIENVVLDTMYATKDVQNELSYTIPPDWDIKTVMLATYDNHSVSASNVNWTLNSVSDIVVKRRPVDSPTWTTIYAKDIKKLSDFSINETDITPTTGEYIYAIVPRLADGAEGRYYTVNVDVEVTRLTITDVTGTWSTFITDGSCNTTNTTPGAFVTTLNDKYPTYVSNTIANYQTITVSGSFYPTDNYCNMDLIYNDKVRTKYIKEFIDFLTNRETKILKNVDGREWLVMVDDGVTDTATNDYRLREIGFSCVEIGDVNDTETLAINSIIDVPEKYWGG